MLSIKRTRTLQFKHGIPKIPARSSPLSGDGTPAHVRGRPLDLQRAMAHKRHRLFNKKSEK